jgi:hypothetical protein
LLLFARHFVFQKDNIVSFLLVLMTVKVEVVPV